MMGVDECNAFFVLSMEEEAVSLIINEIKVKLLGWVKTSQLSLLSIMQWFDVYYQYLRSVMIKRRHRRCSLEEAEKFFMYSSGNPVDNPCEDLKKLHDEWVHSNKPLFILFKNLIQALFCETSLFFTEPPFVLDAGITSQASPLIWSDLLYTLLCTDCIWRMMRNFQGTSATGQATRRNLSPVLLGLYSMLSCIFSIIQVSWPILCFFSPAEAPEAEWMNACKHSFLLAEDVTSSNGTCSASRISCTGANLKEIREPLPLALVCDSEETPWASCTR